jgi:hypothetical protein
VILLLLFDKLLAVVGFFVLALCLLFHPPLLRLLLALMLPLFQRLLPFVLGLFAHRKSTNVLNASAEQSNL